MPMNSVVIGVIGFAISTFGFGFYLDVGIEDFAGSGRTSSVGLAADLSTLWEDLSSYAFGDSKAFGLKYLRLQSSSSCS